jgi:hypothetical protein
MVGACLRLTSMPGRAAWRATASAAATFAQHGACAFEEADADVGPFDFRIALPREKPRMQLRLELFDLIAQRGRADAEAERRAAEVLVLSERHEVTEQTRLDLSRR